MSRVNQKSNQEATPVEAGAASDAVTPENGEIALGLRYKAVSAKVEAMKVIKLPCFGIEIQAAHRGSDAAGSITSELSDPGLSANAPYNVAVSAVESMVLAHAIAGVDVKSPAYLEGIETAVEAIANHHDDDQAPPAMTLAETDINELRFALNNLNSPSKAEAMVVAKRWNERFALMQRALHPTRPASEYLGG